MLGNTRIGGPGQLVNSASVCGAAAGDVRSGTRVCSALDGSVMVRSTCVCSASDASFMVLATPRSC